MVVFVVCFSENEFFSFFQNNVDFYDNFLCYFCFRIDWHLPTCCSLSKCSENVKSVLFASGCVSRLFFSDRAFSISSFFPLSFFHLTDHLVACNGMLSLHRKWCEAPLRLSVDYSDHAIFAMKFLNQFKNQIKMFFFCLCEWEVTPDLLTGWQEFSDNSWSEILCRKIT